MRASVWSIMVKELRQKEKALNLLVRLCSSPYGHEERIKRTRILIQVAQMRFLCWRIRLRVEEVRQVKVELLLLLIKRSELRWFRMPLGHLSGVFCAHPTGRMENLHLLWPGNSLRYRRGMSGFPLLDLSPPRTDHR